MSRKKTKNNKTKQNKATTTTTTQTNNRMELRKSSQQLKYLAAAVQGIRIPFTFKKLRLNEQKIKFHRQ